MKFFVRQICNKFGFWLDRSKKSIIADHVFLEAPELQRVSITAVDSHREKLYAPVHSVANEWNYLFFKFNGIKTRSPFYNRALCNFCLSIPSKWKLRNGRSRFILREYLREYLPHQLYNRAGKSNLSHGIIHNLGEIDVLIVEHEIASMHPYLEKIVSRERIADYLEVLKTKKGISDRIVTLLMAFVSANIWLKKLDFVDFK